MRNFTSLAARTQTNPIIRRNRQRRMLIAVASAVPVLAAFANAQGASVYWDINGTTVGAAGTTGTNATASGTWDGALTRWNSDSTGGAAGTISATVGFANTAVFSAGSSATGASTVTVTGTEQAGGFLFEEGTVTLSGAGTLDLGSGSVLITIPLAKTNQFQVPIIGSGTITLANASGIDSTTNIDASMTGYSGNLVLSAGTNASQINKLQLDGPLGNGTQTITLNSFTELGNNNQVTLNGGVLTSTNYAINNPIILAGSDAWLASANGPGTTEKVVTYAGTISGPGGSTSSGNLWIGIGSGGGRGAVILGNSSTTYNYSGNTYITMANTNGLVQLGKDNILPSTTNLVMGPAGTAGTAAIAPFDLNGHSLQVASLATNTSGVSTIYNTALDAIPAAVTVTIDGGVGTGSTTFGGVIGSSAVNIAPYNVNSPYLNHVTASGNISLTKAGNTTQVFTGVNLYTGDTNINGGALVLGKTFGTFATPGTISNTVAGNVNVNTGTLATVGGLATYWSGAGGRVTAGTGGIISPGGTGNGGTTVASTIGGLYAGSMTLNTGADLKFDLFSASAFDSIKVTNDLTLDAGTHTVDIVGTPGAGGDYILGSFGSVSDPNNAGFVLGATQDPSLAFHYQLEFNTPANPNALILHVTGGGSVLRWDADTGTAGPQEGSGPMADGGNHFIDLSNNSQATFSNANNFDVIIGNSPAGAGGNITLGSNVTFGGKLTFGPISSPYTITDGGGGFTVTTSANGIDANSSATIDAAVTFSNDQTWNVAAGKTLALTKSISSGSTLSKAGSGTLVVNGTGGSIASINLNAGTLETNDPSFIQPAFINIANGTTLRLRTPSAVNLTGDITRLDNATNGQVFNWDLGSNPATFSGTVALKGTVNKFGTADWTLAGTNSNFSASTAADVLDIKDSSTLHFASSTPLGVTPSWENLVFDNPSTLDVQTNATIGSIKNGSQITKIGSGTLTVSGSTTAVAGNTPSIDIQNGNVQVDSQGGLGGGNANTFGQMAITLETSTPGTELIDNFSGARNSLSITMKANSTLTLASTATTGADSEFVGYNTNGTTFTNYGAGGLVSVLTVQGNATIQNLVQTAITQDANNNNVVVSHDLMISMGLHVLSGNTLTLSAANTAGDYSKGAVLLRGADNAGGHPGDDLFIDGGATVDSSASVGEIHYGATGRGKPIIAVGAGTALMKLGSHAFMRDVGSTSDTNNGVVMTKLIVLGGVNLRMEAPMNATYTVPNTGGAQLLRTYDGTTGLLGANPTSTNAGPAPTGYTVIAGGYTVLSTNRAHALSLNFNPNGIIPGITTPAIPNGTLTLAATDGAGATGTINVGPDAASGVTLAVDNTATSGNLVFRFDGTADSGKIANYAGLSVQRSNPSAGSVKAELLSTTKTPRLTLDTTNGVQLDVKQKALLVDYSVTTPLPTLSGYVSTGKNGGTWNGPGIMTSDPDAQGGVTSLATVVAAEASDALGLTTGQTRSFRSQTVDDTTAIVAYVYRGDANLDGKINADDYFAIDSNYNKSGVVTGFIHGDFNEDGLINGDDYAMIDMNYSSHPGPLGGSLPPGGVSAVPEPSMMGACAAALSLLTSRRRRRTV